MITIHSELISASKLGFIGYNAITDYIFKLKSDNMFEFNTNFGRLGYAGIHIVKDLANPLYIYIYYISTLIMMFLVGCIIQSKM